MKIAFFIRIGELYDYVYPKGKPWLSDVKRKYVSPEVSIIKYIRFMYPNISIKTFSYNTIHKIDLKKFDHVFLGFYDATMTHKKFVIEKNDLKTYNKIQRKIYNLKNCTPSVKQLSVIDDKCKMYSLLRKKNFTITPTLCFSTKEDANNIIRQIKTKKAWIKSFMKPIPGCESRNVASFSKGNLNKQDVREHIESLKKKKYDKFAVQKFINTFASKEYPELRTFWVDSEYQYTIETTSFGYDWNLRKCHLPEKIMKESKRIIKVWTKMFGPQVINRIDWGWNGVTYFVNEVEYAPGMFSEIFKKRRWDADVNMAEKIVKIIQDVKNS